jgi:hypothetical protein
VKDPKSKLKYLSACPGHKVLVPHGLGGMNLEVGQLIIDSWDHQLIQVIWVVSQLNKINVIMNKEVAHDRCLFYH